MATLRALSRHGDLKLALDEVFVKVNGWLERGNLRASRAGTGLQVFENRAMRSPGARCALATDVSRHPQVIAALMTVTTGR
jgi:hypothetical protein